MLDDQQAIRGERAMAKGKAAKAPVRRVRSRAARTSSARSRTRSSATTCARRTSRPGSPTTDDQRQAPTKALLEDKKLQKNLQEAAEALRDAGAALREGPKKKRKGGFATKLLFLVVAGGAAVALSEGLRNKLLDALFGAEEEFDYTSTTAPTPASPPSVTPEATPSA
jgi:hypothetical protein